MHSGKLLFVICADQLFISLSKQNNSVSPSDSLRASEKHRGSSEYSLDPKKRRVEEKDNMSRYVRFCIIQPHIQKSVVLNGHSYCDLLQISFSCLISVLKTIFKD